MVEVQVRLHHDRDVVGRQAIARGGGAIDIDTSAVAGTYEAARRGDVALRSAGVDLLNRLLLAGPAADGVRAAGLLALAAAGPLRRLAMRIGLGPLTGAPRLMRATRAL